MQIPYQVTLMKMQKRCRKRSTLAVTTDLIKILPKIL